MKKLLTLSLMIIALQAAHGQCQGVVIALATAITADGTYTSSSSYWVCQGVTATFTASNSKFYIEPGCTLTISGDDCDGSIRGNSMVTFNGNSSTFIHDQAASVVNNGTGNLMLNCNGPLTFDYSLAPSNGCQNVGIEESNEVLVQTAIYPNPANEQVKVLIEGAVLLAIRLTDTSGRTVLEQTDPSGMIDVSSLQAGCYLLGITTDQGFVTQRLVVE